MRSRTIRVLGVLFGLSMLLTACDAQDVLALLEGTAAAQAPAAEAAADDRADGAGDEAGDADGGKSEAREFQCRKDGVRKARRAAAQDPSGEVDDGAPAQAAREDGDAAPTAGDAVDRRDDAPARSARAPARKKASAPSAPSAPKDAASSDGDRGAASGTLSAIERDIADRLNATRRQAGLKVLTLSAAISRGAESWSCDMAVSGNFRHADLRSAGVYGENIAWGQRSAAEVHRGWMNSPGHRDNRMSSRWTEYGVGVCEDGGGHLYFTERFR